MSIVYEPPSLCFVLEHLEQTMTGLSIHVLERDTVESMAFGPHLQNSCPPHMQNAFRVLPPASTLKSNVSCKDLNWMCVRLRQGSPGAACRPTCELVETDKLGASET